MNKLAPGRVDVIENKARHPGEPEVWLRVYLLPEQGSQAVQAFFTPDEVKGAVLRVSENHEDLKDASGPKTLLDRFQKAMTEAIDRFKKR